MYQNGGAKGVLYDKSMKSNDSCSIISIGWCTLQKRSTTKNKGRCCAVQGDWGYLNVGLDSVDMELLEGQERAFVRLCNLLDTPPALFLTDQTYENAIQR
jgi:hypothetical protein